MSSSPISCHACGLLVQPLAVGASACPRCHSHLHRRKVDSLRRTWAFLLAAYLLYIPANLLPIMVTRSLFGVQRDTIMSGIVYLWQSGAIGLALVVFVASILVPLLKLFALTLLVASTHFNWHYSRRQRSLLYRLVEVVGRWSMLDIFVVSLLVGLVQLNVLASVEAAPGALAFAAVVVLTMFAAMSFDPRLIWDVLPAPLSPARPLTSDLNANHGQERESE